MSGRGYRKLRGNSRPSGGVAGASSRSVWQNSSQTFNSGERSSSAFPALNEPMRNLSIDTASARTSRSQSVRPSNSRRTLCSAVPDTAVLTPIRRPDKGGQNGQHIDVYTNHFRVDIDKVIVYQYDVDIVMIDRYGKIRFARKDDRWEVIQTIIKEKKDFPIIWYDEGKTLYSREILPEITLPMQFKLGKNEDMKIFQLNKLNLVRQDNIENIYKFIQQKTTIRPHETVRTIEILFKQHAHNDFICIRNQFYDRRRQLDDLGDGRGMAKGFYQALFLTQYGPTLNINLTFTCFYMPLKFVDFASQYLRKDITTDLTQNDLKVLGKIIRNLQIETMHTGRKIFYRFREFGRPANQLKFSCGDNNETTATTNSVEEITVADYFAKKHRRLQFPDLPCINAIKGNQNKPNWLPMEMVAIVEWQRAIKPLDKTQRGVVSKNTILKPVQRYEEIMKIVGNNRFDRDPYLKELSIHVDDKEMIKLKARIIPSPQIQYRSQGKRDAIEYVRGGKWRIRNWFCSTPEIHTWGMIYFGDQPDRNIRSILENFQHELPNLLERNGFVIHNVPSLIIKGIVDREITETLCNASKQQWQLAIVILNSYDSTRVYELVKRYGNRTIGLMTQCVNFQALKRNISNLRMYVENISQKINGKLGGINGIINLKSALSHSSKDDLFMFFGADVTHSTCSTDRPSIAAVVGSCDTTNNLYAARLCEQYPKTGRCSVEIIKELETMIGQLIQLFAEHHGGYLPNKIIFYRDGVDEGQYQKVLDNEVTKIKSACRNIYGKRPLPQLTFIVVKKRHNTRFFLYENKETLNVQSGTVIDQGITHPSQFDFYLCSQAAIMGTSRPALYHVLHDDNQFSSDDIQQLTYWLCHTDMRCTKSVSIPAPVHYAHLAAYASRALKSDEDHERDSLDDDNEELENYTLDDIKTKLMILDEKVADDMWFL
ncbi:unnamed protein product [Adineta steineri]|uniref:Uncharacterized protein n=1 Tax=Adineta steineri TaxID=433720 RepID=A0A819M618_9BILA|nr:unnamed protein product [Adineta steineri]